MAEEKDERAYPVKSLHDFLFEIDREWGKFRTGSLVALLSSTIMFVLVIYLILISRRLHEGFFGFAFLIIAAILVGYSIYSMYSQYRFFNRWERRIGLLMHLEEELIAQKLGDKTES